MTLLNKSNLAGFVKLQTKVLDLEEFSVRVTKLNIRQQLEFEKLASEKDSSKIVLYVVKQCCIDDDGNRLFDDENIEGLSTDLAVKIFNCCLELNQITQKELEEKAKNS